MARGDRLETERLVLRRWSDEDRAPFAALNADPEVARWLLGPLTRAESDALLDRIEAGFDAHGFGLWAVERRDASGLLGFTGLALARADLPCAGEVEVGWRLARPAWGRGYATEAARAAVAYGFNGLRLAEMVSFTAATNARSRAVMQRLGMMRDPGEDFEHPGVPEHSPMRPHVLYRLSKLGRDPQPGGDPLSG